MKLTDVPGIGPAKAQKLEEEGIATVQELAEMDLRKKRDIGISDELLKRAKQEARKLLDKEGIAYQRAPYKGENGASSPKAPPAPAATMAEKPPATNHETKEERPKGLLARLFRRA